MIHLALWIVSTLFVTWFVVVCGSLILAFVAVAWRWILGAIALLIVILLVYSNSEGRQKPVEATRVPNTTLVPHEPALSLPEIDAVRTALSFAVHNVAPPVPEFESSERRLAYLRWLRTMSDRLKSRHSDAESRKESLQTVWYESERAGLDQALVLAIIETVSNFGKYHVSIDGARGYMSVAPYWVRTLGVDSSGALFHLQTNLRVGCVVLRHYLELHNGDLFLALGDYYESNAVPTAKSRVDFADLVFGNRKKWVYVDNQKDQ